MVQSSIDEGLLEKNEYIYPGYFKVCTNESINNCLNKVELIDILPEELKCKITFGGLLQKEIVVSDNIIINKNQILKAEKKVKDGPLKLILNNPNPA